MNWRKQKTIKIILLVLGLLFLNYLASTFHIRLDLTEENRYSLTGTSHELYRNLESDLEILVFLEGDFPSEFRKLRNSSEDFLSLVKEINPSSVRYRYIDPQDEVIAGKSWADSLTAMGASPINLSVQVKAGEENKLVYPYALVRYGEGTELVNIFSSSKRNITVAELNNSEAMLEYQFARAVDNLSDPSRNTVVYEVGHGEPTDAESFDLSQVISSQYDLRVINLKSQPYLPGPDTIDVLMIVKPSLEFSEAEKLKIDQYVMRGGKLLLFIDNLFAEPDSLSFKSQLIAYERGLNIQDLLFNYGVRINPDLLLDLQCDFLPFAVGGTREDPQFEFLHWNYYPLFESQGNHSINKNIGLVSGRFVNTIDTIETEGILKTPLLQSSNNSRTISTPALISPNENRNTPQDALFNKSGLAAAYLLEGSFSSFYNGRISRAQVDSLANSGGFQRESDDNKMIIVADGDIVMNDVSPEGPLPMGLNLFTVGSQYEYQFANRDFLLNCLEYLTSKSTIIETRNKEIVLRLLDPVRVNEERLQWQLINIALPIMVIILFGLLHFQWRKKRYAHR